jgi:hypothetical protein
MDDYARELLGLFIDKFWKNLKIARECGALSGDEPKGTVVRAVLAITADNFASHTEIGKETLANLRHFV